jgi:hypothetical protein
MLSISNVPLNVYNRALEIFGEPAETNIQDAIRALGSAESRMDSPCRPLTPLALALAEYMSLSGPWSEGGEHDGECGYSLS